MSTSEPKGSAWERSLTRQVWRWLISPRILRRFIFAGAVLLTLVILVYTFENWRGKRAWRTYSEQLKAEGVALDFASVLPPEIPARSNFAATPFFADLFQGKPSPSNVSNRWPKVFVDARSRFQKIRSSARKSNERYPTDLVAWQIALRKLSGAPVAELEKHLESANADVRFKAAQEVLAVLKVYEPVLRELRDASGRPDARYLVHYDLENPWGILLPHLVLIKEMQQLLQLKGNAELAAGNVDAAFDDFQLQLRIVESLESEPFLISHVVRIAALHIALHTLWEGMDHWSDAQLALVQARLAELDFVASLKKGFAAERSAAVVFIDLLQKEKHRGDMVNALVPDAPASEQFIIRLYPMGWFDMERRNYVEMFQAYFLQSVEVSNRVVSAALAKSNQGAIERQLSNPVRLFLEHRYLAKLFLPAIESVQNKTAQGQAAAHQAIIACALERHHRAKGSYPAELAALTPQFLSRLPHDPVNGGPMRYKPGRVYSVGWDEKDDGGLPGKALFASQGDWVWSVAN